MLFTRMIPSEERHSLAASNYIDVHNPWGTWCAMNYFHHYYCRCYHQTIAMHVLNGRRVLYIESRAKRHPKGCVRGTWSASSNTSKRTQQNSQQTYHNPGTTHRHPSRARGIESTTQRVDDNFCRSVAHWKRMRGMRRWWNHFQH